MLSKKVGFLVLILTAILSSVPLETRAAGADCGPKAFQEFVEHACDTIPLEWTWNPLELVWTLVKTPARIACEEVEFLAQAATGEVLDPIIGECCRPHDECYAKGGTSACKDKCDDDFSSCVADKVEWWMWVVSPVAAAAVKWGAPWTADNVGGDLFEGFNLNNDSTCGNGASEDQYLVGDWDGDGRANLAVRRGNCVFMDTNFDGAHDIVQCYGNGTGLLR
jgi:hypothetical protein